MQVITLRGFGMARCDKDCLNCKLPKCIHDIEDEPKPFKPPKARKPKKNREVVVQPKRGRPKKERKGSYWDEYYSKNGDKVRARSRERYYANHEKELERGRKWREAHKDYYKEWYRKRKEKEHEHNRESESIIGES
jgi:hypothetical protein